MSPCALVALRAACLSAELVGWRRSPLAACAGQTGGTALVRRVPPPSAACARLCFMCVSALTVAGCMQDEDALPSPSPSPQAARPAVKEGRDGRQCKKRQKRRGGEAGDRTGRSTGGDGGEGEKREREMGEGGTPGREGDRTAARRARTGCRLLRCQESAAGTKPGSASALTKWRLRGFPSSRPLRGGGTH
jgi:hypothetical protein